MKHFESLTTYLLVGKYEGKTPPGRPKRRWDDNIKTCFKEKILNFRTRFI
jgi:hypothetical protein